MKRLTAVILMLALLCGCSAHRQTKYRTMWLDLFDTCIQLTAYADSQAQFDGAAEQVYALLYRLDAVFDLYEPHEGIHGLYALNHAEGEAVFVEPELMAVLKETLERQETLTGAVNAAMGSVLLLWHEARETGVLPTEASLSEAARHIDPAGIELDGEKGTARLLDPEMRIDLGAVAKGWAMGEAGKLLDGLLPGYLLDGGGNIVVGERPADGREAWVVGVYDPTERTEDGVLEKLSLTHACAVTSGGYQRCFEAEGQTWHHLIDPVTLYPARYCLQATVICADSALADFLSTAAFVLPTDQAKALIESLPGVQGLWVLPDGEIVRAGA